MGIKMIVESLVVVLLVISNSEGAEVGTTITNTSVLLGEDAHFYCEVIGTQGVGETLTYTKNTPAPAGVISADAAVTNETKYTIDGTYNLTVKATTFSDEGQYECTFGTDEYLAYLVVCDPPTSSKIYWGEDEEDYTEDGKTANLTCESGRGYPPSTFRWFKGSTELTNNAVYVKEEDNEGYGKAYSYLELIPESSDEGDEYKCYVDIAAEDAYFTEKITISFSGVSHIMASISTLLLAMTISLSL